MIGLPPPRYEQGDPGPLEMQEIEDVPEWLWVLWSLSLMFAFGVTVAVIAWLVAR